uniref:Uncharacterized protein n=1 Tax=Lactuca sativa TaxID=4236 RepID=A0A9R1UU67_LACSA|nr:hypothetical protein LSAT_V11C800430590 [Lactuca sativa]
MVVISSLKNAIAIILIILIMKYVLCLCRLITTLLPIKASNSVEEAANSAENVTVSVENAAISVEEATNSVEGNTILNPQDQKIPKDGMKFD